MGSKQTKIDYNLLLDLDLEKSENPNEILEFKFSSAGAGSKHINIENIDNYDIFDIFNDDISIDSKKRKIVNIDDISIDSKKRKIVKIDDISIDSKKRKIVKNIDDISIDSKKRKIVKNIDDRKINKRSVISRRRARHKGRFISSEWEYVPISELL